MRHLITLFDLTRDEIVALCDATGAIKREHGLGRRRLSLEGKVLALVFEKPSLRTRVSFQTAMAQLGGASIYLSGSEAGLGTRESVPDFARVLSAYADAIVLRTFAHHTVETFRTFSSCPVINGLSDYHHPCQALADLFTVREALGTWEGKALVFVGDGNNVARSLAIGCAHVGMRFILATPPGYRFDEPFRRAFRKAFPGIALEETDDPMAAVSQADVIYTDVWASMGQESEREQRARVFQSYQVNEKLLERAPAHAVVMHCLPAHRGEEISSAVLDSPRCIAFQQAANRLHLQKALLEWLLAPGEPGHARVSADAT